MWREWYYHLRSVIQAEWILFFSLFNPPLNDEHRSSTSSEMKNYHFKKEKDKIWEPVSSLRADQW